jgi:2-methylcitrate dehydratase PrpD
MLDIRISRREILRQAGRAGAVSICFPLLLRTSAAVSPVMTELSTYMSGASNRALPAEGIEQTKLHVLDTFAAMISGSELSPGRAAIRFAEEYLGEKVSTVVATPIICAPIEAALTNAMLSHSDETDDSHAPSQSHPGCCVVPAALAAGEKFGVDGTRFLRTVALGYDVGCRVTMTLGGVNYQAETHRDSHSTAGVFGAAAAAASAASLNAQQMRWVLDYAAQQCAGLAAWKRDSDHIEKAFVFAGMPARSGTTAALVVYSGWTGVDDIFSGDDNFLLANASKADPTKLTDQLGQRYEITRTNIKKWTVGSPIQAPLDAMELLLRQHHFTADQVREITVTIATEEAVIVDNRDIPDICLQHMIALMLVDGTATFRSAHDKSRMQDPVILRERAKVKLIPSEELEAHLPAREAIVEVTLAGGMHLKESIKAVRGTAENPMSRDEIVAKARDLMDPVLGKTTATALTEKILALESVKDMKELRPLLQGVKT